MKKKLCLSLMLMLPVFASNTFAKNWKPDGSYSNRDYNLNIDFRKKEVSIGSNICWLNGRLTQSKKNSSQFIVKVDYADGMVCPDIKTLTITVLDGQEWNNKAKTLKVSHKIDKNAVGYAQYSHRDRVNFSGYYTYTD
ncbi:hypothetical protein B0187_06415 [Haemophilus paracuniculus]|uniref:DUF2541 domain-containing protein n=1 Tax=Haemophilus paracuniculus TaxID=734 RepID=A0A1T0ARN4_9PAST|nr:hypothetical protein [Haemophilus paracuniculus]OOR98892.1 hypothetical protein B0187_06415 [Haemophilus paracuniculus]